MLYSVLSVLAIYIGVSVCKEFRYDYTFNAEADGYFKLHRIPTTWHDARLRCRLEGAVIASPSNFVMYSAIRKVMKEKYANQRGIFTGIHATFSKGDFMSMDGVPLNKMPIQWMPEEPNNLNNDEDCIVFLINGTIGDVSCKERYPYICFKKRTKSMVMTGCGTTDREYTLESRTGNCYKFHRTARTWKRAFMTCAAEGAHLAIPNSHQEASVLQELFEKNPPKTILQVNRTLMREIMHLGFHDWGEMGDWSTIHGEPITQSGFNVWSGGQPDNAEEGEHCGSMFRNGLLNDVWCNEIGPFVCEMVPDNLIKDEDQDGVLLTFRAGN